VLVSETSGPVSSRTRSSEKRTDDGGDRESSRGGDTTTATATGRGATVLYKQTEWRGLPVSVHLSLYLAEHNRMKAFSSNV